MATDLNLHRKTSTHSAETAEGKAREREVHNRERTWLICFCLDRSLSAQMGKPTSIKEESVNVTPSAERQRLNQLGIAVLSFANAFFGSSHP